MATELEFTVGVHERHQVVYSWDQFSGRLRITVDGEPIVDTLRVFSVSSTAEHEFTVGDREVHRVRIVKERPMVLAGFRPQPITASVDGQVVAHAEATMRRGQTIGIGVGLAALFVGALVLQLVTRTH